MARRLSVKNRKRRKDIHTAYEKHDTLNRPHKVADERSKKALKKKAFRMA